MGSLGSSNSSHMSSWTGLYAPLAIWLVRAKQYIDSWPGHLRLRGYCGLAEQWVSSGTPWDLTKVVPALEAPDPEQPAWSLSVKLLKGQQCLLFKCLN